MCRQSCRRTIGIAIATIGVALCSWGRHVVAAEATAGLVAHWSFDEGRGEVAKDSTANRNSGTLQNGPVWIEGKVGKALQFDGVDDAVDFGNPAMLQLAGKISVELWFKPDAAPQAGEPIVIGKNPDSYAITYYTDGYVWFYISSGGNSLKTPLTLGEWHHLVGTFDGKMMSLYVDGELKATKESPHVSIVNTQKFNLVSGKDYRNGPDGTPARLTGAVDEIKIYNRALTTDEVKQAFEAAK